MAKNKKEREPIVGGQQTTPKTFAQRKSAKPKKVWIDIDNSPHVPFFLPIIEELEKANIEVVLTARDIYQVCRSEERRVGKECSS